LACGAFIRLNTEEKFNDAIKLLAVLGDSMRIHFGIKHGLDIIWPDRCLWCGGSFEKRQKYKKKSIYDFEYRIFWFNILSRVQTIYYPLCQKHYIMAHLLRPSRLLWASIILFIILADIRIPWLFLVLLLPISAYFYYQKKGLIIHKVGKDCLELSLPDGKYAEEFGLLNNCNNIKGHLLIQD
jgi:hypothetical protein